MSKFTKDSLAGQARSVAWIHSSLIHSIGRVVLFTTLLCASALVGKISIPGTAVGITMQTFVLMVMALTISAREGVASIVSYISLGAIGLPVFSGGASTLALIGPSAGFIWGFIPALLTTKAIIDLTKWALKLDTLKLSAAATITTHAIACFVGFIVVLYTIGVTVQTAFTGVAWLPTMIASMGFVPGDLIKITVATLSIAGISAITHSATTHKHD